MTANGSQAAPPDHGLGPFGKGATLVVAATAALAALPPALDALAALLRDPATTSAGIAVAVASVRRLVEGAAAPDGRNLLIRRPGEPDCFFVFGLTRQLSGALGVRPIEIDTATIALAEPDAGVLDRLEAAVTAGARDKPGRAALRDHLASLRARINAATSRLSIVRARLDVQARFLTAMFATEAASMADLLGDPGGAGARRIALDMRRQLGGRRLTGDGHGAVEDLFGSRDAG